MGERAPWGSFPKVIRNGDLGALKDEREYQAAKSGDSYGGGSSVNRSESD